MTELEKILTRLHESRSFDWRQHAQRRLAYLGELAIEDATGRGVVAQLIITYLL